MTSSDPETLLRIITATEKIRNIFTASTDLVSNLRHAFSRFDENGNGLLDHGELMNAITSIQKQKDLSTLGSEAEISEVIHHAISSSNFNSSTTRSKDLTFTQFSLFFFGSIASMITSTKTTQSQKQHKKTTKLKCIRENSNRVILKPRFFGKSDAPQNEPISKSVPNSLLIRNVCSIGRLIPFYRVNSGNDRQEQHKGGSTMLLNGFRVATQSIDPVTIVPCAMCTRSASVFFEIEIEQLSPGSVLRVGWADALFQGGLLGSDEHSWAISGTAYSNSQMALQAVAWSDKNSVRFGDPWKIGDVIGCLAEHVQNQSHVTARLRFGCNGSWRSPADIVFDKVHHAYGLIPGISVSQGVVVRMIAGVTLIGSLRLANTLIYPS